MDLFSKLRVVALQQGMEGEFPAWLLADILEIAGAPDQYQDKRHLIETLITQVENYNPYAGAGCFDLSFGAETIQRSLHQIMRR